VLLCHSTSHCQTPKPSGENSAALDPLFAKLVARPDLQPRNAYWQVFPSDVRAVKIDNQGKPWLELEGDAPLIQIKEQVENSFRSPAHWVKAARILLFDSTGKIWLTPSRKLLLAFDPKAAQWIERSVPNAQSDSSDHDFCGPAIEDKAGRVYIGDRSGCHVFDHGGWSYQPFYELNARSDAYFGPSRQFAIPQFTSDDRGRIFAWATWGTDGCTGTLGFWVHEGTQWHQTFTDLGERAGRLSAVVPLQDGKVLLCPESGKVAVAWVDFDESTDLDQLRRDIESLGSRDFHQRRDAEHRILELGPHVLPELRKSLSSSSSPEQRNRLERIITVLEEAPQQPKINDFSLGNARMAGHDNHGNAVLWADTFGPDGRAGRTAAWLITPDARVLPAPEPITEWAPHSLLTDAHGRLFMARYQKGLGMLDQGHLMQLSDETDIPFDEILGQDAAGRIYVRNKWHVGAINLDVPDTRRTLAVTAFDLSSSRAAACQDSTGKIVAKLSGADHRFLSVYENGQFVDLPVPAGGAWISDVAYLQPLKNSALVAQEQPGSDVFFFDGKSWRGFRSFRALVELKYQTLIHLIDNRRIGVDSYAGLRVDSHNNIWCMQWDHVDTYDGKAWQSFAPGAGRGLVSRAILYCLPLNNGNVVLSDSSEVISAQTTAQGINATVLLAGHGGPSSYSLTGLRIDADGRAWLPRSDDSATVISDHRAQTIEKSGIPRLQDAPGRIWFVDPSARQLIILDRSGARDVVRDEALSDDSTIVQEDRNSFWVNTRSGLRHLVSDERGSFTADGDYFEKAVPKGACNGMWIDPARNLWFSGSGRLYRIALPK
jgi:streptogramin lyase